MVQTADTSDLVRAGRIGSALFGRVFGRADAVQGPTWRAVYVERGEAEIVSDRPALLIAAPSVAWVPWCAECRLVVGPGTVGVHVLAGATPVANAIGHKAESAELRLIAGHRQLLPLTGDLALAESVADCFRGILRETSQSAAASATVVEAHLRILMIQFWRVRRGDAAEAAPASPSERLVNRFYALVEAHFRERWPVAAYARSIGISVDRLNDVCRRTRGRTPKQLLSARTVTEARLMLENSSHSTEQIAGFLGFPSVAHFSRFFRQHVGIPPGRHRQDARKRVPGDAQTPSGRLYEWP